MYCGHCGLINDHTKEQCRRQKRLNERRDCLAMLLGVVALVVLFCGALWNAFAG